MDEQAKKDKYVVLDYQYPQTIDINTFKKHSLRISNKESTSEQAFFVLQVNTIGRINANDTDRTNKECVFKPKQLHPFVATGHRNMVTLQELPFIIAKDVYVYHRSDKKTIYMKTDWSLHQYDSANGSAKTLIPPSALYKAPLSISANATTIYVSYLHHKTNKSISRLRKDEPYQYTNFAIDIETGEHVQFQGYPLLATNIQTEQGDPLFSLATRDRVGRLLTFSDYGTYKKAVYNSFYKYLDISGQAKQEIISAIRLQDLDGGIQRLQEGVETFRKNNTTDTKEFYTATIQTLGYFRAVLAVDHFFRKHVAEKEYRKGFEDIIPSQLSQQADYYVKMVEHIKARFFQSDFDAKEYMSLLRKQLWAAAIEDPETKVHLAMLVQDLYKPQVV